MPKIFTTEITSEQIPSDNPIHQRLFKAYIAAEKYLTGDVLEVGCGEGRGVNVILQHARTFTAVDKISEVVINLGKKFPQGTFLAMNIPPLKGLESNAYDVVITFQVIEHIDDDKLFLREIHRVLKPGGLLLLTTPNRRMSLTRNPWHVREYVDHELKKLAENTFAKVEMKGITGNEKVMSYYEENKRAVQRLTKWDFLDLQHRLPASWLRLPYEILNRWNRNKLQSSDTSLVYGITQEDYYVTEESGAALDLFMIAKK